MPSGVKDGKVVDSVKDNRYSVRRTICEVHRQIYDLLLVDEIDKHRIIELLEESYGIAKKMNTKLVQYKKGYCDDWFEKNKLSGESLRGR